MRSLAVFVALGVVLVPSIAPAHPVPGAMPGSPFRIIARPDPHNGAGVDFAFGAVVGEDDLDDEYSFRFDLHGRFILSPNIGLTLSFPISALKIDSEIPLGDQEELAIGNIDAGLFFVIPVGAPETSLVVRGGLTLPTASEDGGGIVSNFFAASVARITDVILAEPKLVAFRGAVSLIHDAPGLTLRFDGGVDLPIATTIDDVDVENDPLFRLNAGAAIGGGPTRFVVEIANLANENSFEEEGEIISQLGLGLTTDAAPWIIGASYVLLLDSAFEDDIDGTVMALVASATTAF